MFIYIHYMLYTELQMSAIENISQSLLECEQTLADSLFKEPVELVTRLHLACHLVSRRSTMAVVVPLVEQAATNW